MIFLPPKLKAWLDKLPTAVREVITRIHNDLLPFFEGMASKPDWLYEADEIEFLIPEGNYIGSCKIHELWQSYVVFFIVDNKQYILIFHRFNRTNMYISYVGQFQFPDGKYTVYPHSS